MSGLSGGNIGFPGASDSETVAIYPTTGIAPDSSFHSLTAAYNVRRGGDAGSIVGDFESQVLTAGTGTYAGDASNITVS